MPTVKDFLERFQNQYTNPEECIAVAIWTTDDVLGQASQHPYAEVTKEEAQEIVCKIHRKHDATLGITWTTIDSHLDELAGEQRETLIEELLQLECAEAYDHVDTSLSTLKFRNKRISEIQQELTEKKGVDIAELYGSDDRFKQLEA